MGGDPAAIRAAFSLCFCGPWADRTPHTMRHAPISFIRLLVDSCRKVRHYPANSPCDQPGKPYTLWASSIPIARAAPTSAFVEPIRSKSDRNIGLVVRVRMSTTTGVNYDEVRESKHYSSGLLIFRNDGARLRPARTTSQARKTAGWVAPATAARPAPTTAPRAAAPTTAARAAAPTTAACAAATATAAGPTAATTACAAATACSATPTTAARPATPTTAARPAAAATAAARPAAAATGTAAPTTACAAGAATAACSAAPATAA